MQELLGIGTCVIDVHGNDDEGILPELALHLAHPGKRLATGRAPRGPEVKIDHSPAKFIQIKRRIGIGWRDHKTGVSQEDTDTPTLSRAHRYSSYVARVPGRVSLSTSPRPDQRRPAS